MSLRLLIRSPAPEMAPTTDNVPSPETSQARSWDYAGWMLKSAPKSTDCDKEDTIGRRLGKWVRLRGCDFRGCSGLALGKVFGCPSLVFSCASRLTVSCPLCITHVGKFVSQSHQTPQRLQAAILCPGPSRLTLLHRAIAGCVQGPY